MVSQLWFGNPSVGAAAPDLEVVQAVCATNGGGGTTVSVTIAAPSAGNRLVAAVGAKMDDPNIATWPGGWVGRQGSTQTLATPDLYTEVVEKIATGSEGTTLTVTLDVSAKASLCFYEIRDINGGSLELTKDGSDFDGDTEQQGNSTAPSTSISPGLRHDTTEKILIGFTHHDDTTALTENGDLTEDARAESTGGATDTRSRLTANSLITTAQAGTKTHSGSLSGSEIWTAWVGVYAVPQGMQESGDASSPVSHTSSATATGRKDGAGVGTATTNASSTTATGTKNGLGAPTVSHTSSTSATGASQRSGTGTASHASSTPASGSKQGSGAATVASHSSSATASGGRSASGAADPTSNTSSTSATGAKVGTGTGSATSSSSSSGTGAKQGSGTGTASHSSAPTGAGAKSASGTGTATHSSSTSETGLKGGTGRAEPASNATAAERLIPDAVVSSTGFAGVAVSEFQVVDGVLADATSTTAAIRLSFPTPSVTPSVGEFSYLDAYVYAGTSDTVARLEYHQSGSAVLLGPLVTIPANTQAWLSLQIANSLLTDLPGAQARLSLNVVGSGFDYVEWSIDGLRSNTSATGFAPEDHSGAASQVSHSSSPTGTGNKQGAGVGSSSHSSSTTLTGASQRSGTAAQTANASSTSATGTSGIGGSGSVSHSSAATASGVHAGAGVGGAVASSSVPGSGNKQGFGAASDVNDSGTSASGSPPVHASGSGSTVHASSTSASGFNPANVLSTPGVSIREAQPVAVRLSIEIPGVRVVGVLEVQDDSDLLAVALSLD